MYFAGMSCSNRSFDNDLVIRGGFGAGPFAGRDGDSEVATRILVVVVSCLLSFLDIRCWTPFRGETVTDLEVFVTSYV